LESGGSVCNERAALRPCRIAAATSECVLPDASISFALISDISRPGLPKTRILSASSAASVTECVMKTVVFYSSPIRFSRSLRNEAAVISSSAENASSASSNSGLSAVQMQIEHIVQRLQSLYDLDPD
jgi:hypothetical protein